MLSENQKRKLENDAKKFPDIDLINFVSRGRLIVLQTSGDYFEKMPDQEKLNSIDYMVKSLNFLRTEIIKNM